MKLKAYPVIYSRTKLVDFGPDFIIRPEGLHYSDAARYIQDAMIGIDFLKGVRYCVFNVKDYCICGGIACISKELVNKIGNMPIFGDYSDYLTDIKGRSIACFIGFAIAKKDIQPGIIPKIDLKDYWEVYLKYIKNQWRKNQTTSEEIREPIEIEAKQFSEPVISVTSEQHFGKEAFIETENNIQDILDICFNRCLNGQEVSFISNIDSPDVFKRLHYHSVSVPGSVCENLKRLEEREERQRKIQEERNKNSSVKQGNNTEDWRGNKEYKKKENYQIPHYQKEKNPNGSGLMVGVAAAIVVILIIVWLISRQ